jgi:hypothetical protein
MSVALIVSLLGLAGLNVVRIERKRVGISTELLAARQNAESAVELALAVISADPNWRTGHTNGAETTPQSLGPNGSGTVSWIFEDSDGSLTDADTDLRLKGVGRVDSVVQVSSVQVQQPPPSGPNLLTNHDMENGTTDWSTTRCDIQSSTSNPHGGAACLEMTNGESSGAGPQQYVTGVVENGVTYYLEVWARKASGTSYVRIAFAIESSGEGKVFFEDPNDDTYVDTAWTKCTTTLTPTWSGTLDAARVKLTVPSGTYDMLIDDAVMIEQPPTSDLQVVAGTWLWDEAP